MAQKWISDFFHTKPKKQAKIIKYCNSKVTNERKDKEGKLFCLSSHKESEKQVKSLLGQPKREKKQRRLWKYCETFTIYTNE